MKLTENVLYGWIYWMRPLGGALRSGWIEVASVTFPEPGREDLKECASSLFWFFKEIEARDAKEKEQKEEEEARALIEKECEAAFIKVSHAPPACVIDRPLTSEERDVVVAACQKEIDGSDKARNMLAIVRQFALFYILLGKPENRIMVRSGQLVGRTVKTRLESDMTHEMAKEFVKLPRYTAYARLAQRINGEERIDIRKIRTRKPVAGIDGKTFEERVRIIEKVSAPYYVPRALIEEEIRARLARWRQPAGPENRPDRARRINGRRGAVWQRYLRQLVRRRRRRRLPAGNENNTLIIEKRGQKIALGITGHTVVPETVMWLTEGHVGLFVEVHKDDVYAEA